MASKIDPFVDLLGKVPDAKIAELSGLQESTVAAYRRERDIPAPGEEPEADEPEPDAGAGDGSDEEQDKKPEPAPAPKKATVAKPEPKVQPKCIRIKRGCRPFLRHPVTKRSWRLRPGDVLRTGAEIAAVLEHAPKAWEPYPPVRE